MVRKYVPETTKYRRKRKNEFVDQINGFMKSDTRTSWPARLVYVCCSSTEVVNLNNEYIKNNVGSDKSVGERERYRLEYSRTILSLVTGREPAWRQMTFEVLPDLMNYIYFKRIR
jgi:hypothetical protein